MNSFFFLFLAVLDMKVELLEKNVDERQEGVSCDLAYRSIRCYK